MEKIDKLILEILQLNPSKIHKNDDDEYYLIYKDITLFFSDMRTNIFSNETGLVNINLGENYIISKETKLAVLEYFKKEESIDELLIKINNDIRKKKLTRL